MDFSWALISVKKGDKISREGWNGKNQYVQLQIPDAHSKMGEPYLYLTNVQGKNVPWLPSQGDLFAKDWCIKED
jgi:hypothetical protein